MDLHVDSCTLEISGNHSCEATLDVDVMVSIEESLTAIVDEHTVDLIIEELHHDDVKSDTYEHKDLHVDSCILEISRIHSCEATLDVDVMVSIEESLTTIVDEHTVDLIIEELHHDDVKLHTYDHKDLHVDSCKPDIGEHHNTRHSAQEESSIEVIDEHSVECIAKESRSHEFQADTHEHKDVHVEGCSIDISSYHTKTDRDQEDNNGEVIDEHLVECRAEELHHDDAKSDTHEHKDLQVDSCTLEISGIIHVKLPWTWMLWFQ